MQDYKDAAEARELDPSNVQSLQLDDALLMLAKTGIIERRPRSHTGQIPVQKSGPVIVCNVNDSLDTLMQIISTENILGCPIVNESNILVGMLDVLDILSWLFTDLLVQLPTGLDTPQDIDSILSTPERKAFFEQKSQQFSSVTLSTILAVKERKHSQLRSQVGTRAQFTTLSAIPEGHSLLFALELLAHTGCRRVAVTDHSGHVTGIYSQSMGLSDIRQSMHLLRPFGQLPVSACMTPNVISLSINARAIDAFILMAKHNITGIALTDEQGKLTGVISVRDIRGCGVHGEYFDRLFYRIRDFKDLTRKEFPNLGTAAHWSGQQVPQGARYIELSEGCISDAVRALNDGNLGRVIVMDNERLVGIVTQRDIIRTLLKALGTFEQDF